MQVTTRYITPPEVPPHQWGKAVVNCDIKSQTPEAAIPNTQAVWLHRCNIMKTCSQHTHTFEFDTKTKLPPPPTPPKKSSQPRPTKVDLKEARILYLLQVPLFKLKTKSISDNYGQQQKHEADSVLCLMSYLFISHVYIFFFFLQKGWWGS